MANKFKEGQWVEVQETKHVLSWSDGKKAVGFRFRIQGKNKNEAGPIYLDKDNKFMINYLASDLKLINSKTMATKKKAKKAIRVVIEQGMYFTATRNRKKIRGVVGYIYVMVIMEILYQKERILIIVVREIFQQKYKLIGTARNKHLKRL